MGALVGTILMMINQGDVLVDGALRGGGISGETLLKILLTYCVPYCVSTYASVSAVLDAESIARGS